MQKRDMMKEILTAVKARKAVGATVVRVVLFKDRKVMWIGEFNPQSREGYVDNILRDGRFAAHLRKPIEKAIADGADDHSVTTPGM